MLQAYEVQLQDEERAQLWYKIGQECPNIQHHAPNKIWQVYECAYRVCDWLTFFWVHEFTASMLSLAGVLVGQRFQGMDTSVRTILLARMVAWLNSHLASYVAPLCICITPGMIWILLEFDMEERTSAVVLHLAWLNAWWFCTYKTYMYTLCITPAGMGVILYSTYSNMGKRATVVVLLFAWLNVYMYYTYIANMYSLEGVVTGAVYLLASYELHDELAVLLTWRPDSPSVRIAMGISNLGRLRVWVSTASGFAMTSKARAHQCGRRCVMAVSARRDRFVDRMTRPVRESRTPCARGDRGAKIPECPVCFETYGRGRNARILDCGHTVCQGCIAMMLAPMPACDRHHKNVACPSCRVVTAVVHGDARRLVRNFDLESMCIQ